MTPDEMRADIIKRIVALRKTKAKAIEDTRVAEQAMKVWINGGPRPNADILQQATMSIQIRDHISISCYDQEEALRKLAKNKGIDL